MWQELEHYIGRRTTGAKAARYFLVPPAPNGVPLGTLGSLRGKTHRRWSVQRRAVRVERRPVHHSITRSAMPACVPTSAVSEADDMPDEDLIRTEGMHVGASAWCVGDPLPGRGLYQLGQHDYKPSSVRCLSGVF
jgi:hypothetical protein